MTSREKMCTPVVGMSAEHFEYEMTKKNNKSSRKKQFKRKSHTYPVVLGRTARLYTGTRKAKPDTPTSNISISLWTYCSYRRNDEFWHYSLEAKMLTHHIIHPHTQNTNTSAQTTNRTLQQQLQQQHNTKRNEKKNTYTSHIDGNPDLGQINCSIRFIDLTVFIHKIYIQYSYHTASMWLNTKFCYYYYYYDVSLVHV